MTILKYAFTLLIIMHALIHLIGFFKAFQWIEISVPTSNISRAMGVVWLITALFFLVSLLLKWQNIYAWHWIAVLTVACSQLLIFTSWSDARFGTIINLLIFLFLGLVWAESHFVKVFHQDVNWQFEISSNFDSEPLSEGDLAPLPVPVQNYLRYVGVVGKPKANNFFVELSGRMRSREQSWFHFRSEQYNFVKNLTRFFFMRAHIKGVPTVGYHAFDAKHASMRVKLFSLFPVVSEEGKFMDQSETVTVFNDMCLLAPAMLIDPRITWEDTEDSLIAIATFWRDQNTIRATLHFNEEGQLVNFSSRDRFDVGSMKKYEFTTPVHTYQQINGFNLPHHVDAVWHYEEEPFIYGKVIIDRIVYNLVGPP